MFSLIFQIYFSKLEKTLVNKERELDNAKGTIIQLKQEMRAMVEKTGDDEMSDSIGGGNTNEKPTIYYQGRKFRPKWNESEPGLNSDSGMESIDIQINKATDATVSPAGTPTDSLASPADTSFSPADTSSNPAYTPFSPAYTPFSPANTPSGPADISFNPADTSFSPAYTPASPTADKSKLKSGDFPDPNNFTDFSHYYYTVSSFFYTLTNMGYKEEVIISSFIISMSNSRLAKTFFHNIEKSRHGVPKNCNELLDALGCCDTDFINKTPLQRFNELNRHKTESLEAFLNRCEIYSHAAQLDDSKRTRYIKNKFLEGGNIPKKIQEKLKPYSNLYELLIACKKLISRQKCNKKSDGRSKANVPPMRKLNNGQEHKKSPLTNQKSKQGTRPIHSPTGNFARPLMDIEFPSKTIFIKKADGLSFDQVITKCNGYIWD